MVDKATYLVLRSGSTRLNMPKKTKREKMLAASRRTVVTSPSMSVPQTRPDTPGQSFSYQFQGVNRKKIESERLENSVELAAIKTDLVKTLLLASVAIAFELILYTILHNK